MSRPKNHQSGIELEKAGMKESKILLVDDDEFVLSGIGTMLKSAGYKVTTAESGEKANKLLEKNTFNLIITDITDRKQAEKALRESEERFRKLAESITDPFFAMDKDLRYTYWNTASEELTGISEKEAIGKTLYELFPDVKGTAAEELYLQVLKTKKAKSIDIKYHLGNQDYVFELNAYPTKAGCSVLTKDITKRRQTEEKLRKSEARLKEAQRVGRVGDWSLDVETQEIFWSEQLYGLYERDPALDPPSFEEVLAYFSPEDAEKLREQVRLAIEQGQEFDTDLLLMLPSGKSGYQHIIIKVEKDQSGRVVKLHGTVQDITDRKRTEMELRRAHAASETAMTGIITVDLEGTIIYANPAAARMWGVNEPANMFGTSVFDYHPDRTQTKANRIIQHLYEEGTYREVEGLPCKRKDGSEFLAEVTLSLMIDEFGKPVGMAYSYVDITERKRVKEELKLQAQMLENISSGVYLARARDGIIVYTNPRFAELFGYEPGEMIGKHVSIVHAPTDKNPEEAAAEIMGFMEKHGYWQGEIKNIKKDGTPFWCYASFTYFDHIDHGRVLVATHTDISDQKQSQERIQALARFASENPNPVLRISRDGTLLYSNEASSPLLSAWGYKGGEPLSEELRQLIWHALSSGMSQQREIEAEAGNIAYSLTFAPVVDSDYVNVYALDITEQKTSEAALKESEGKYRAIFDSSEEAIFIFDVDGSILETNNKASKIYGYSQKEFKNLSIEKLIHPDDRQIYFEHLANLDTQSAFLFGNRNVCKDGSTINIAVSSTTIYIKGKKYVVSIITDITERKHAEEELALRQQQLIQADKMASIGTLSSGIAHEINNPNQIIRLFSPRILGAWESIVPILEEYYEENGDFLLAGRKYSEIGKQIPSFFSKILDGSNRIDRIVNDLKDFVRMDRSATKTEIDVNIVIRSSITLVTYQINKSTLNFSTQLGKKLPRINGNAQQLEQVLVNLVQNACDALTNRQQGIHIKTVYEAAKRRVKIDVQDEGEGIPPDKIAKITEPFFTMKEPGQGTGLGLSVSLNIIREHKGSLSFSSEPGKGTTATIHLPVR